MTGTKRNTGMTFIIFIGLALFIVLQFVPLENNYSPKIPFVDHDEMSETTGYITGHYQAPNEYLVSLFEDHDVVFVGEYQNPPLYPMLVLHQNADTIRESIPLMYEKKIYLLAMDHVCAEDQSAIDEVLLASEYDEKKIRNIFINRMPFFIYQEYADIFKEAWSVNRNRQPGSPSFRIIGLNLKIDYLTLFKDKTIEPETNAAVYNNTVPEEFIFSIIEREIIQKNLKALVFADMYHCIKKRDVPERVDLYTQMNLEYSGSVAYKTIEKIGKKAFVVLQHNLWIRNDQKEGFPINGYFDAVIRELPENKQHAGFSLAGGPFEKRMVVSSFLRPGDQPVPLSEIADGYIFQGPLNSYRMPHVLANVVDNDNFEYYKKLYKHRETLPTTQEEIEENLQNTQDYNQMMISLPE